MRDIPEFLIAFLGSALLTSLDLDQTFYIPSRAKNRVRLYAWWYGFIAVNGAAAVVLCYAVRDTGGLNSLHPWARGAIVGISFPAIIRTKFTTITVHGRAVPLGLEALYEAVKSSAYKRINRSAMQARYEETMSMANSHTLQDLASRAKLSVSQNAILTVEERKVAVGWMLSVLEDAQTQEDDKRAALADYILSGRRIDS